MAIISVSGETGCPHEELAGLIAHKLSAELLTEAGLQRLVEAEFPGVNIPEKAWTHVLQLIVARIGAGKHVVVCVPNAAGAIRELPSTLRVNVTGSTRGRPHYFDLVLNSESFSPLQMLEVVETAMSAKGLTQEPALPAMAQSQVEFKARLKLAKYGISPPHDGRPSARTFTHPSEQIFANLLDFYRIRWEYEPRSFPLQWDKDGKVLEAFTPDFYLSEFDLYVEITTMKQSLVTKKNRKVRLLRAIYPHINIRVFYEKDFQELVSKYGLTDRGHE
jgi:hypothetical protein